MNKGVSHQKESLPLNDYDMIQRSVCLCDGKYIGIENIFTVIDGKQINIPDKLNTLRVRSKKGEWYTVNKCGDLYVERKTEQTIHTGI